MDAEWQLDAFDAERSPSPEYIPRSMSNSPMSISSADSRSSTAEPASPNATPEARRIRPSMANNSSSRMAPAVVRCVQGSAPTTPAPWTEPPVAPSSIDKVPTLDNAEAERARVAAVLKSIGVPALKGSAEISPHQLQDYSMQLMLLEQAKNAKKRRDILNANNIPRPNEAYSRALKESPVPPMALPSASKIAGGAIFSDGPMAQPKNDKTFRPYLPPTKISPVSPQRPISRPPSPDVRNKSDSVLDACELGLHLIHSRNQKRLAEERLETFKSRPGIQRGSNFEGEPEGLGQSFKKSQRLFAIAQVQLQEQLGMSLTDQEKGLANIDFRRDEVTEQQIRDEIFVEAVKVELLTLQIQNTKCMIERSQADKGGLNNAVAQRKEAVLAQVKMAAANATAMHFAKEKDSSSTRAEIEQTDRRREERDRRNEEADELIHKPAQMSLLSLEKGKPNTVPSAPPFPLPGGPPVRPWGHRPSFPLRRTPASPHPIPGFHVRPSPQPPGMPPALPSMGSRSGPAPPPPGTGFRPPPPPGWPPGAPPPPPRPPGFLPYPRPTPSTAPQPEPNAKTIGTIPAGLSVKTSTSIEGSTTTTMTTNPDFEVDNGIEIVTKTVRSGGSVTTVTTTTLIPLIAGEKRVKSWLGNSKEKEKAQTDDGSGDESDSLGSRSLVDD